MTAPFQTEEPPDAIDSFAVVELEYKALKDEQISRMRIRDNLPYVALAAAVTVVGASTRFGTLILLVLPVASTVLGWKYLANDAKVCEIGCYVRTVLTPYVARRVATGTPVFGWEDYHRRHPRRRSRMAWQLLADLAAFCVTGVVALALYWVKARMVSLLFVVSLAEVGLLAGLGYQIVRHADLGRKAGDPR